ncbi:MAG: N-acetyltransferase, partial [Candidatus Cloacimonetes bacterium]|nr:N-acetyltransferase [Candidatus Cloacimonadota bacterium]
DVTAEAFTNIPVDHLTEHFIILALRTAGALTISLVAEIDDKVVGHVAFSPITISDGTKDWYGLGPVAVKPGFQKQGIGKALINEGLSLLKKRKAKGCALVGDRNYYKHFGFKNYPQLIHEGVPQKVFLVLPFTEAIPTGNVTFHKAFLATR